MSTQHIGAVIVRLAAVFIVVTTLQKLPFTVGSLATLDDFSRIVAVSFALNALIPFAIAWLLWKFPHTVAGGEPGATDFANDAEATGAVLMQTGIALLGLYALTFGVIEIAFFESQRIVAARVAEQSGYGAEGADPFFIGQRVSYLLQVVVGLALILGRETVAGWLAFLKTAGTKHN